MGRSWRSMIDYSCGWAAEEFRGVREFVVYLDGARMVLSILPFQRISFRL